ncbi:MAG: DUF1501 domain-containing protein [Planctomycetaceae bacterium]
MLSLFTNPGATRRQLVQMSRREALAWGSLSTLGLSLPSTQAATVASPISHPATAKRCIYIFLCGGPSQIDMWDPKPHAPDSIRGPFNPIATNVPSMHIGDLLPLTAQRADKFAIIRSMTHSSNAHDIGIKYTLLADSTDKGPADPPSRSDHPGMGGILRSLLGETGRLPAWVTVPRPFTTGSRYYRGQTGGFLGATHDPFLIDEDKKDSLADKSFSIRSLKSPTGVDDVRFDSRRSLLQSIDHDLRQTIDSAATHQLAGEYEKAFDLIASPEVRGAFNLEREPTSLRDRYGRNEYGQSFLLARRLVESGVRYVNVFWTYFGKDGCQFNLWDNHGSDKDVCGGYNSGVDMIRGDYCCPAFDKAFSALLDDLTERGLLDDTLVVVTGEFGRTPKINQYAGRDHWSPCYSTVLAGGGIRGGAIHGASDEHAAYVKDSPVRPEDLGATILHAFGFSPDAEITHPTGRPVRSSKGQPVRSLFS